MHIQPCQCLYSVTAEALCHCSAVGFTSQTQTAKVTFEFPGITTMLYLTGLIMFPPVCALQTRVDRPFGAFLFWSNKKVPGCKRFGSWRHLAAQIHCFFWAFWEHIIKMSLNHLFSWISCSCCIAIGCVLISYIFRNGCFIVSSFLFRVLLADIVKGRSVSGWPCCTISEPQRAKRMIHRASRGGKRLGLKRRKEINPSAFEVLRLILKLHYLPTVRYSWH